MGIFSWKGKKVSLNLLQKKENGLFWNCFPFDLWTLERGEQSFSSHYVGQLLLILMRGNRKKCHQSINIETTCFMCLSPRSHTNYFLHLKIVFQTKLVPIERPCWNSELLISSWCQVFCYSMIYNTCFPKLHDGGDAVFNSNTQGGSLKGAKGAPDLSNF